DIAPAMAGRTRGKRWEVRRAPRGCRRRGRGVSSRRPGRLRPGAIRGQSSGESFLHLVEASRPVFLEQPGEAPIGQQPTTGLASGTVVRLVVRVSDPLYRRTADRAWLP